MCRAPRLRPHALRKLSRFVDVWGQAVNVLVAVAGDARRPRRAIRQADRDGNPVTVADPTWTPLLTAPYPEHASGHMCLDGAHLRVLQLFFGTDEVRFGVTSSVFGGETRFFDRFSDPLKEITDARVWAGLHFRTSDVQGRETRAPGHRLHGAQLLPAGRPALSQPRRSKRRAQTSSRSGDARRRFRWVDTRAGGRGAAARSR